MSRRDRSKKDQPGIGPRIVRAWFDTVMNPMLNGLRAEHALLERKDWTWQFHQTGLEMIKPAAHYIDQNAVDNLEQILKFLPGLKTEIKNHDTARESLFDGCRGLHNAIVSRSDIEDIYRTVTSPQSLAELGKSITEMFSSREQSDHINLLSEYIVNNTRELPYYYTVSPLWNRHRVQLLKVLDQPAVAADFKGTLRAGEELMIANETLVESFQHTREDLSLQYDVPYVGAIELSLKDTM